MSVRRARAPRCAAHVELGQPESEGPDLKHQVGSKPLSASAAPLFARRLADQFEVGEKSGSRG